jgi:hypothetical protein
MSADGSKILAGDNWSYLYVSSDGGTTWSSKMNDQTRSWYATAMTADGSKMIAVPGGGSNESVFQSTDGGATWTTLASAGIHNWQAVAMSADGNRIALTSYDANGLHISNDSGATWQIQAQSGSSSWMGISMSADGSVIYAANDASGVFKGVSGVAPSTPVEPSGGIQAGNTSITGTATPGSTILVEFPGGLTKQVRVSMLGTYTMQVPAGMTLKTGDTITLRQQSAAGVLGASTTITVLATVSPTGSGGSLANTGMDFWMVLGSGLMLVVVSVTLRSCFRPRRMTF